MRKKKRKVGSAMSRVLRFRPTDELKHWNSCDSCGKRFSELDMVWIEKQGWLCGECQKRIT